MYPTSYEIGRFLANFLLRSIEVNGAVVLAHPVYYRTELKEVKFSHRL